MTDAELLRLAQRGDVPAWRSLYARCLPMVWRQAVMMVGDETLAEDVVSETLLAFVRELPTLDAETVQLPGWLRGVVRHKVGDYGRQRSKHRRLIAVSRNGASNEGSHPEPSVSMEAEERRERVFDVLDELSDLHRSMLEWKHVDGLSVREIAERVSQTEKAVESTLYRARKEFRRLFEQISAGGSLNGGDPRHKSGTLEKSL